MDSLYIVVRRTTDWTNEATVRAQLPKGFEPLLQLWNETFDMPYHRFRQRLKEIAQANLARVEGAVVAVVDDVPAGALIAPIDDDDWFSPDLATTVLAERDEGCLGFRWPSRFLEVPPNFAQWRGAMRRRLFPGTPLLWLCTTNNYAIAKIPEVAPLLSSHMKASDWFSQNAAAAKVLDVPLSVQNRNIASQTSLLFRYGVMTRSKLMRRHRQYRSLYAGAARRFPAWCRPSIEAMADLMQTLQIRRRSFG